MTGTGVARAVADDEDGAVTDTQPPLSLLARDHWASWSTPPTGATLDEIHVHLDDHLAWLRTLEVEGSLVLSGPMPDEPPGTGLTVVRAPDADAARAIVEQDPLVIAGLRTVRVYRWRINEGSVGITVSLATGTFEWR